MVDIDSVLRHHDEKDLEAKRMDFMKSQEPPEYGLLSQTVICSPLVHWILPVSLRSPSIIDIAFIGVSKSHKLDIPFKLKGFYSPFFSFWLRIVRCILLI